MPAIPLALSFYYLFTPPEALEQAGLFTWLTLFAVQVRFFMTLYQVPGEDWDDYADGWYNNEAVDLYSLKAYKSLLNIVELKG